MDESRYLQLARKAAACAVALAFGLFGALSTFAAGPTVTIQFWHAANGAPTLVDYFQAYEKTHPNIKINQTVYVDDDYKTQSRVALSAGTTPDVWYTNTGASLSQFVDAGGLMDITSVAKAKGWTSIYDPEAIKMCSIGNTLYGLPWSNYTPWMVLWANKDFFQSHKMKYPRTVDELIALAKPLRDLGQEPLVFYNKDGWTGAILFGDYVLQQVGAEFVADVNSGKLKWTDSKAAKVALETLAKMAKAGLFLSDYATSRQDTALLVWKDQRSPLLYNGTWFTQVTGTKFDFKVDTIVMPLLTPTSQPKAYQNWVDWTLGVCPSSKIKDAALEFMAYAANVDYFTISGTFQGNLTPVPAANKKIDIPYFFKTPPILGQLPQPKTPFFCWAFPLPVIEVLQTQIKLVMSGQVSADDALQAIEAEHAKNR